MPFSDEQTISTVTRLPRPVRRQPFLVVLSGPQFGEIFPLNEGRDLVIGRRNDADVCIRDDGVSRRHATVRIDGGAATLSDLGSANGTFVDGKRVDASPLGDAARISIGVATTLKFFFADELEARWQKTIAQGALHDPLTGLYNRRHLEQRLAAELALSGRHHRAVSLIVTDVDRFKEVNDRHGHLAGDEVLKMVALALRRAVRKEDIVARFGGEEFMVLARETSLVGARMLGERIRRTVESSRAEWRANALAEAVSIGVTVSVGITEFVPGRTDRDLLTAADRALYLAKQSGRNCVVAMPMDQVALLS